jgi:hypothetical protein
METVFNWRVANLERETAEGVVFTVHYTISAEDGVYASSAYGSLGLEPPDPETMIPFAQLTEEIVVGWVKERLTEEKVEEVEAALQAQLDEQHSPSKAVGLPWQG